MPAAALFCYYAAITSISFGDCVRRREEGSLSPLVVVARLLDDNVVDDVTRRERDAVIPKEHLESRRAAGERDEMREDR